MYTTRRHCLLSVAASHGYHVPTIDVSRLATLPVDAALILCRVMVTILAAVLVERQRRQPFAKQPSPVAPIQPVTVSVEVPCAAYDEWSEALPAISPPSELANGGRIGLPMAPPLLWPMALPLVPTLPSVVTVEKKAMVREYNATARATKRTRRRETVMACEVVPTAVEQVRNVIKRDDDGQQRNGYDHLTVHELRRLVPGSRTMRREELLARLKGS